MDHNKPLFQFSTNFHVHHPLKGGLTFAIFWGSPRGYLCLGGGWGWNIWVACSILVVLLSVPEKKPKFHFAWYGDGCQGAIFGVKDPTLTYWLPSAISMVPKFTFKCLTDFNPHPSPLHILKFYDIVLLCILLLFFQPLYLSPGPRGSYLSRNQHSLTGCDQFNAHVLQDFSFQLITLWFTGE